MLLGALLAMAPAITPGSVGAQEKGATGWGTEVEASKTAPAPGSGWETKPAPPPSAVPNTTVVPRAGAEPAPVLSEVQLIAQLTEDGQRIDQGLVWRVFTSKPGVDGKPRLISLHRDPTPMLRLPVGDYFISVAFGRAHLTRRVGLKPGAAVLETFVLNAGGLRVQAVLTSGGPVPDRTIRYEIYSGERNQSGERDLIMASAKPGVVIRLNAGFYHIVSTYGDANSIVRTEVSVEAGKLTEAVISHAAARIAFRLVERAGGEALPDTSWIIQSAQGAAVKQNVAAITSHILAPGSYKVTARHGGKTVTSEFTVTAGEPAMIELIVPP
jgi:hypothetical protein